MLLSIYLSTCLSICLSVYLSVCLSVSLSIYMYVHIDRTSRCKAGSVLLMIYHLSARPADSECLRDGDRPHLPRARSGLVLPSAPARERRDKLLPRSGGWDLWRKSVVLAGD